MKAIYLLYENAKTIIPVPNYYFDKHMHYIFTVKNGGFRRTNSNEYVFNYKINIKKLSSLLPDTPIIRVGINPEEQDKIIGFFERSWHEDDSLEGDTGKKYFSDVWQNKLLTELHARKYSKNTIDSYLYYNRALCQWLRKPPDAITLDDVKEFLAYRETCDKQSAASLNLALSAIKFFFKNILKNDIIFDQKRPRQDKRLPVVLSKKDIKLVFAREKNLKHKLLMMIVYSSGLRVSEVIKLKKKDIDFNRKTIIIHSGKGRKDRYTITSEKVIAAMKEYLLKYDITEWLFPGQPATRHLNKRTAQYIFENALKRACIEKSASIHSLRHSFATHLLESGIDITYIKELLGHASIRTTERYTHVARRKALVITSPLDTVDEED